MTFVLLKLWHSPAPTAWRYGKYRPKFFSVYSIIKNSRLNKFHPRGASVNMLPMINVSERLQPCFSNQRYKLWHSYRRLFTLHSASIPTSIYKKLTSNHGFYQVQKKRQPISHGKKYESKQHVATKVWPERAESSDPGERLTLRHRVIIVSGWTNEGNKHSGKASASF